MKSPVREGNGKSYCEFNVWVNWQRYRKSLLELLHKYIRIISFIFNFCDLFLRFSLISVTSEQQHVQSDPVYNAHPSQSLIRTQNTALTTV
jgi:hypothetical protein